MKMTNYVQAYRIANLLLVIFIFSACQSNGVTVTIENNDTIAIDSLELNVTGHSYFLGTISPG